MFTRRRCCPTARCSSQADLTAAAISRARNSTIRRAGPDRHRQPHHRTRYSHGDVAAQRQGARRRRFNGYRLSRERGTLRSGERDLDGHRQPRHRTRYVTRRRCCPTARCSSQAVVSAAAISRARNSTIRRAGPGRPPAASPPHAHSTRRRCCPTARCSSQADVTTAAISRARNSTQATGWRTHCWLAQPRARSTATQARSILTYR